MKPLAERQKDEVECAALALQAAAGSYLYDAARQSYLQTCLESRGWRWILSY